jgi:hypothetical protein
LIKSNGVGSICTEDGNILPFIGFNSKGVIKSKSRNFLIQSIIFFPVALGFKESYYFC